MDALLLSTHAQYHTGDDQHAPWQPGQVVKFGVATGFALACVVLLMGTAAAPRELHGQPAPTVVQNAAVPLLNHRSTPSSLHPTPAAAAAAVASSFPGYRPTQQAPRAALLPLAALVPALGAVLWYAARASRAAAGLPPAAASAAPAVAMAGHSAVKVDAGGLEYVALKHANGSSAKVYLFGADVTSYVDSSGTEWLAVRPDSKLDGSKPISGGLSHCFPQFGPGQIQQHGFARNVNWAVVESSETSATFELTPSEYTKAIWDHPFRCRYTVTLGPASLDTELVVENTGKGDVAWEFQAALHSYFAISNIKDIRIGGSVTGKIYLDKLIDRPHVEARKSIAINEEYDRVYFGWNDPVLRDQGRVKQLRIVNHAGWKDTVVWNPYGNTAMGYEKFVCVESVAYTPVELKAGQKWFGVMSLRPEPLPLALAAHTGVKVDAGGLEYVPLSHPNGSSAKVYLFGADVTSYADASGTEWLAVRPDSKLDGSKPISGGLSHCFPQFGPGQIQQHGFARNVNWTVVESSEASATFELTPSEYTKAIWDHPFRCRYTVTVGPDSLDTELVVENTGAGDVAWEFQAALHSYFAITNINNISIGGSVTGKPYLNKLLDKPDVETRKSITIGEEYDRVYFGWNDPVLRDQDRRKQLQIVNHAGWKDTVLWNPYGNTAMGYEKFVCVESVAFSPVELKAGQQWVGSMSLRPEPLPLALAACSGEKVTP